MEWIKSKLIYLQNTYKINQRSPLCSAQKQKENYGKQNVNTK